MAHQTLLTIVQNACSEIGIPVPTSVIGNQDQTVSAMLALVNREGKNLAKMRNMWGGGWSVLEFEHTFSTVASQEAYSLPSDFGWLISDTVWDRSTFFQTRGSLSPQQWQNVRSGLAASPAMRFRYRIKRTSTTTATKSFFLDPIPAAVETHVFEYVSDHWTSNAAGNTFDAEFNADTDISLLDEEVVTMGLIWRYKRARGLSFAVELADYETQRDQQIGGDGGKPTLFIARKHFRLPPANTPETGFGV